MGKKPVESRVRAIVAAFKKDGYDVDLETGVFYYSTIEPGSDRFAIAARHITATVNGTGKKKKAFYLEGTPKQMGYMLGYLAEEDVSVMAVKYVENFIWAFLKFGMETHYYPGGKWRKILKRGFWKVIKFIRSMKKWFPWQRKFAKIIDWLFNALTGIVDRIVVDILNHLSRGAKQDIPDEYLEEMQSIYEGCKAVNPKTKVCLENLLTLNVGIDVILAYTYHGIQLLKDNPDITPEHFDIPIMCNGFSATGNAVKGDNHYMGRDFMFPTAGAFQDAACMIIYNPDKEDALPFVSVTGPGMVGTIAGLNSHGVAIGVDISPSGWVNPDRPGFNSLLLCRQSIQYGPDIDRAVEEIKNAQRGVSWNYILADGKSDRACIVEAAGVVSEDFAREFPPEELKIASFLEDVIEGFSFSNRAKEALDYIKHEFPDIGDSVLKNNGIHVRRANYDYPQSYLKLNDRLFAVFNKELLPDAMGRLGFINRIIKKKGIQQNTPYTFYFAPQREDDPEIVLTTNFFVDPDMRYTVMNPWLGRMFRYQTNDFQWRYDTLNSLLLEAANEGITYEKAREIIDFLNPKGKYPWYYGRRAKVIQGSLSLFDLKAKTVESHYGYYGDEWIKLSLMRYVDE